MPNVAVTGFASFYGPYNSYQMSGPTNMAYVDNLTWIHGSHMFKFGGTAVRDRLDQNGQAPYLGNIAFNNTSANTMTTGSALADTIMGQYYTYTEAQYDPWGRFRYSLFDGYVQDSYKVARNLNLEIGAALQPLHPHVHHRQQHGEFRSRRFTTRQPRYRSLRRA